MTLRVGTAAVNQGLGGLSPWNVDVSRWFGSTAPTVGQKAMAASIPVVLADDQTPIEVIGTLGELATEATLLSVLAEFPFLATEATLLTRATEATLATRLADATFTSLVPAALVGGRFDVNVGSWLGSTAPTVGQKAMSSSVPVVIASDQSTLPATLKSGTAVTAMASTNGSVSTGTASANVQSIAYLFHPASVTKRIEIVRIDVSFVGRNTAAASNPVSLRGAFITAENGVPGGTAQTINPLDRADAIAADTFRTGATGAPTRVAGDLMSFVMNDTGNNSFSWTEDETGKPIGLRASVAEGFEIRSVVGASSLVAAMQVAVTFYWKEI
jgi:hypothetical protein